MLERQKRFGCPKCGNDGTDARFREINIALVDNYFEAFSGAPGCEGCVDKYVDQQTDFEGAKTLARGTYQCMNCDAHFDVPLELPGHIAGERDPDDEPLCPALVVADSQVVWSDTEPATVVIQVNGGDASVEYSDESTVRIVIENNGLSASKSRRNG